MFLGLGWSVSIRLRFSSKLQSDGIELFFDSPVFVCDYMNTFGGGNIFARNINGRYQWNGVLHFTGTF